MVNLFEKKALQDTVLVGGSAFPIYTDFRVWIRFVNEYEVWMLNGHKGTIDVDYLFKTDVGFNCWDDYKGIIDFAYPYSQCPHGESSGSNERILDYAIDSDYIYAAFLSQYRIDLLDIEYLHYHKFKALMNGISKPTRLYEIMSDRSYTGKDKEMQKIKNAWTLPVEESEEDKEAEEKFNEYFG